jgi:hypothetical protein
MLEKREVFKKGFKVDLPKYVDLKGQAPRPTVTSQISVEQLAQYQQAAEQVGFRISTLAREGQNVTFWTTPKLEKIIGEKVPNTVRVQSGHVAISIEPPEGKRDFQPFWNAHEALKQPQTGQKG